MIILSVVILLVMSGIFSGLTIAYMSFDIGMLERLVKQNNIQAIRILSVRKYGVKLLSTLILGTTLANAFATVLVGDQFSGIIAGLVSAALIFLLADVLPQSLASHYAFKFASAFAPFTKVLLFIFHPITAPVAFFLKKILGEEKISRMSKLDLLSLLEEDEKNKVTGVDMDERRIARGSLLFSDKKAGDVMTPNTVVMTIASDTILDMAKVLELKDTGYSRIPVYEQNPHNFIGILYLKDLIGITMPSAVHIVMDTTIHFVHEEDPLDRVLAEFISTKMHLFVVLDEFGGFAGVITVEDILEEIIGQEIMDEDDVIPDLRLFAKARQKNKIKK